MIGFAVVSSSQNTGLACLYSDTFGSRFLPLRDIKPWLEDVVTKNYALVSLDSHKMYRSLLFLGPEFLEKIKVFDLRSYYHNVTGEKNVNMIKRGTELCKIDLDAEMTRINRIWKIQRERDWEHIPMPIKQVYLQKEATLAFEVGKLLSPIAKFSPSMREYMVFFQNFLIWLARIENTGLISKEWDRVTPLYDYDSTATGRIINTEPFCYQTKSIEKVIEPYRSRFEKGKIILADWRNADFRVAAGLSKEILLGERDDPYTLIAKKIYGKEQISDDERDEGKKRVLSIMYGYSPDDSNLFFNTYPKIARFKREITESASKTLKVESPFGKVRTFSKDAIFSTMALASLCQMTVADFCKKAIIETQKEFSARGLESVPIPIIRYDAFCFDIKPGEEKESAEAINKSLIDRTIPSHIQFFGNFDVKLTDIYT